MAGPLFAQTSVGLSSDSDAAKVSVSLSISAVGACSRRHPAKTLRPSRSRISTYSGHVGMPERFLRKEYERTVAAQAKFGSAAKIRPRKPSGSLIDTPSAANSAPRKCRRFHVTRVQGAHPIAAAATCRSLVSVMVSNDSNRR
jgi:hypothetical protein